MKIIKSVVNHFFLGVTTIASNKIAVLIIFCLGIYFLNTTKCYKEELEKYENDIIVEKITTTVTPYYSENGLNDNSLKDIAASNLVSCINQKLDLNELDAETKQIIDELNELYNSSLNNFSFLYKDIYTGFTLSYNEEGSIFTASTIKAPAMIYLYELASKNELDLNEELTYTENFYSEGSGILKDKEPNTKYKVGQLIEYSIHDSDNIAYRMLMNRYGRKNMYNFWTSKGTTNIYKYDTIWGMTSAKDASIYMQELYDFYLTNDTYGTELINLFKNATWKQITNKDGLYNTASKGGWSGTAFHDAAIVFEENPYILVILSNLGESDYNYLFKNTSQLIGKLHEKYWQTKINKCNKITQY